MSIITDKAAFFAAPPALRTEEVEIAPGVVFKLQESTVAKRLEFERSTKGKPDLAVAAAILIEAAVDDEGKPIFTQADAPKVEANLPLAAVKKVAEVYMRLNSLGAEAEDAEKN